MCDRYFRQVCLSCPIKNKKGKTVLNALVELVNESNCERNKLQVYLIVTIMSNKVQSNGNYLFVFKDCLFNININKLTYHYNFPIYYNVMWSYFCFIPLKLYPSKILKIVSQYSALTKFQTNANYLECNKICQSVFFKYMYKN